jgi:RimJ/RimL family protein N-acetyltransferase
MDSSPARPVVARLDTRHAAAYRALMLEAYAREPEAFTSTPEERAALPMDWWERRLGTDSDSVGIGAFDGDTLVGAIVLERESRHKTRHKASIVGMYVRAAHRGLGLGVRLMEAALDAARSQPQLRLLELTVSEGNASARALYERFGFRAFGTEPMAIAVDGRYIGKVHMTCDLEEANRMANDTRDIWFPAKRYGWGWGPPVKWQGWVVLLAFVAAVIAMAIRFSHDQEVLPFVIGMAIASALMTAICWWKGEKPRWRWGDPKP